MPMSAETKPAEKMSVVYSHLKFLRFAGHLEALRTKSLKAPVHIRIKPNNHCNHNCWYCAYRIDNLGLGEDMKESDSIPAGKMFAIVDDLINMGVKAVTFSGGGEPLIYKPLPDCIRRLAEGGVKIGALTNGSNLKGRMARAFADYGTWVRISTNAWDDESYAAARGVKAGAFSALLENMRAFSDMESACVLGVSFIVGHDNGGHIAEACAKLKEAGAGHVKVSGVVVGNDVIENNLYHREIRETVAAEIDKARELEDGGFAIIDHYHDLAGRFEKPYTSCPSLQFLTIIGADCGVYTCQDKAYTEAGLLGSIKERSFKEFWFSNETQERIFGLDPSRECNHHCISHGKNLVMLEYLNLEPGHDCFV